MRGSSYSPRPSWTVLFLLHNNLLRSQIQLLDLHARQVATKKHSIRPFQIQVSHRVATAQHRTSTQNYYKLRWFKFVLWGHQRAYIVFPKWDLTLVLQPLTRPTPPSEPSFSYALRWFPSCSQLPCDDVAIFISPRSLQPTVCSLISQTPSTLLGPVRVSFLNLALGICL